MKYLLFLLLPYITWFIYLAIMALKRARDEGKLSKFATSLGYPGLAVGYVMDFLTNVLICTPLLLEIPKETTVTARLRRHKKAGGWRGKIATWVGDHFLDPFEQDGAHL